MLSVELGRCATGLGCGKGSGVGGMGWGREVGSWGCVEGWLGLAGKERRAGAGVVLEDRQAVERLTSVVGLGTEQKTVGDLEQDLGFKSSILYSKNFDKTW
eukprot:1851324-Rhodomonas_salina.1